MPKFLSLNHLHRESLDHCFFNLFFNFHSHGLMSTMIVLGVIISRLCMVGPPLPGHEGSNNWYVKYL